MKKLFLANAILILVSRIVASGRVHAQGDNVNALMGAVKDGNIEEVKRLIEKGVDVNANDDKGFAPLAVAAANSHTEIVKLLLDKGADMNVKESTGKTALDLAQEGGFRAIVDLLKKTGAK